jgi:hypothetical protein
MVYCIRILGAMTLAVLPGAWLGFSVPDRRIPWHVAAALSVALGPAVLAVEVVLFGISGQPFSRAVSALSIFNLLAVPVIALRIGRPAMASANAENPASLVAPLCCFGMLIFVPLAIWVGVPGQRVYGWHNMMQLNACYQVANLPAIPQEWEMAGLRLNYGWLGLIQLTAISWLLDCSPTMVYPWLNALQLLALVVLIYETSRKLESHRPLLLASTIAILLFGTNLVGMLAAAAHGPPFLQGEMRTGPFVIKYVGIDAMIIGLSLAAGLAYTIALATTQTIARLWLLVPLLILGTGLSYPLLIPSTVLLAGLCCLFLRSGSDPGTPQYSRATRGLLVAGTLGAVVIAALYLRFLSEGRPMHALQVVSGDVLWTNLTLGGPGIALMFALAYPTIRSGWHRGNRPVQLLSLGGALASILYFATQMPDRVQYKNIFTAIICLAPLVSTQLATWFSRLGRGSGVSALSTLLVVASLGGAYSWVALRPRELPLGIPVDESSFYIRAGECADEPWLEAIRTGTPPDTLLVMPDGPLPVSTLTQRASLVAAQSPGVNRVGHGQGAEFALLVIKGYPQSVYASRRKLLAACYSDRADFARLTAELQGFRHAVALVFEGPEASYLAWLRSRSLGSSVAQDSSRIVWLLPTDN